jgi:hypothetical protein
MPPCSSILDCFAALSRILGDLKETGAIGVSYGAITISDLDLSSTIAAGDREIAPRIGFSAHFRARSTGRMNDLPQVICPSGGLLKGLSSLISDFQKNIFVPTWPKSLLEFSLSRSTTGAYRDRHGRGMGCGGRGSVLRATGLQGGLAKGP